MKSQSTKDCTLPPVAQQELEDDMIDFDDVCLFMDPFPFESDGLMCQDWPPSPLLELILTHLKAAQDNSLKIEGLQNELSSLGAEITEHHLQHERNSQ